MAGRGRTGVVGPEVRRRPVPVKGVRPVLPRRRLPGRILLTLALLAGLTIVGWVAAVPAQAHATVVSSSPTDGARLATVPGTVSITFDEQVGLGGVGYLHVVDQSGHRVDVNGGSHPGGNGAVVVASLKPGLGQGVYLESWRVISADSHPVAGTIRFVVGNAVLTPELTPPSSPVSRSVGAVFAVFRWIGFVGLALLGGLWVLLTLWPAGRGESLATRIVWSGWGLSLLGALGQVLLQGPYSAGEGLGGLRHLDLLGTTLQSDYGQFLMVRVFLLVVFTFILQPGLTPGYPMRNYERSVFLMMSIALVWTFSWLGHPHTTKPVWISVPVDAVHLLAMGTWTGGLVILVAVVLPRASPVDLTYVLPRFSRVALASVVVLAGTGTYSAWRGIGAWSAWDTAYGLLVLTKVALFVVILVVANVSRVAAGRRIEHTVAERGRIARAVLVELAIAVVVLGVSATLVSQPRGTEALATRQLHPVSATTALGGGRTVRVTIDPARHGTVSADVVLSPGPRPRSVTVTAALPAAQLGPIPVTVTPDGTDRYQAGEVSLPAAGSWTFTIVVSTSEFDAVTAAVTIHLS